jgi:hypothetical protein
MGQLSNKIEQICNLRSLCRPYTQLGLTLCLLLVLHTQDASGETTGKKTVIEATLDLDFQYEFESKVAPHSTKVLIDKYHQTIYRVEDESHGAHGMLDIMHRDGFETKLYAQNLESIPDDTDILIIHGLPNEKLTLANNATMWKSPLTDKEVEAVSRFVAKGGSLFLSLSHFPGGSGAFALLEALDVKFRDGYVLSPGYPSFTSKDGKCSNFFGMTAENEMLFLSHPMFGYGETVNSIDFHCGAAVFRDRDDTVIGYPKGSENYSRSLKVSERSDDYAAMIAFQFGAGKVAVTTDQGMFRNFIFTFDSGESIHVTMTSPTNDNAALFVNLMRWLSPKIESKDVLKIDERE